jgi:hypothetical protein
LDGKSPADVATTLADALTELHRLEAASSTDPTGPEKSEMTSHATMPGMPRAGVESVEFGLNIGVLSIKGTWKPSDHERNAAWELFVELATRVAVVPLNPHLLRAALTSHYSPFATARGILRKYGPAVGQPRPEGSTTFGSWRS